MSRIIKVPVPDYSGYFIEFTVNVDGNGPINDSELSKLITIHTIPNNKSTSCKRRERRRGLKSGLI